MAKQPIPLKPILGGINTYIESPLVKNEEVLDMENLKRYKSLFRVDFNLKQVNESITLIPTNVSSTANPKGCGVNQTMGGSRSTVVP